MKTKTLFGYPVVFVEDDKLPNIKIEDITFTDLRRYIVWRLRRKR